MYFTYYRQQTEGSGTDAEDEDDSSSDDNEFLTGDKGWGCSSMEWKNVPGSFPVH